jgi:hypothetical protein
LSNREAIHVDKTGTSDKKDWTIGDVNERVTFEVVNIIGNGIGHGVKAIESKL